MWIYFPDVRIKKILVHQFSMLVPPGPALLRFKGQEESCRDTKPEGLANKFLYGYSFSLVLLVLLNVSHHTNTLNENQATEASGTQISTTPRPDQMCIHCVDGNTNTLLTFVEYKPPHEL
jgi:hypothetical protein